MTWIGRTGTVALLLASISTANQNSPSIPKIGTVHLQAALLKTEEGQAAAADLKQRSLFKEQSLKKLQSEIAALRDELNRAGAVGSQDRNDTLAREIEHKTKLFNRQVEDVQAELDQEQNRILNDLGNRMLAIIQKFAATRGYGLVIDVRSPQSAMLFASESFDITSEVTMLFDAATAGPPSTGAPSQTKK